MSPRAVTRVKIAVFAACLLPLIWLVGLAFADGLGANPVEFITHWTGTTTLALLLATLSITPLRRITGQLWMIRLRRMVGLFAFFYACLHFLTYLVLDQFFDVGAIAADVAKRPYITAGFTAFVLLIPLAVTSTQGWVRRLGGKRWQRLHRLIYVSAVLGVVHFLWLVKADLREPLIYAAVLGVLMAYRAAAWVRRRTAAAQQRQPVSARG